MSAYIFRLDDIAPNMAWDRYVRLRTIFTRFNVKPLIAVIPQNEDPNFLQYPTIPGDFWEEVRERQRDGWHIAQHGYRHLYDSTSAGILGVSRRSEFAGHSYEEQLHRLAAGKEIFSREGIEIQTFVAPSHSFDHATLRALKELGIGAVSDGFTFYPYRYEGLLFVPQLTEMPRPCPFGVHTFCLHSNTMPESLFHRIEVFLQQHHEEVIPFEQAARYVSSDGLNSLVGYCARVALKAKRSVLPVTEY